MKIASWNVNSLRVRLPQVLSWLEAHQPDVLALQETKVTDEDFPAAAFQPLGYRALFNGQKTYNGVALLSRNPLGDCLTDPPNLSDTQRRIIAASAGSVRVVNLYVPNGSEVGSDKYGYKLDWLERIADFLIAELACWPRLLVVGDFNIAPEDRDVYDPDGWRERILCSTPERQAFGRLLQLPMIDTFREFEQPEASYTWWDYRTAAFRRNQGLRIDHILASPALKKDLLDCRIDLAPRKQERPSDHAPIWVEFRSVE
jgi:exodeoxyribonuclease-3